MRLLATICESVWTGFRNTSNSNMTLVVDWIKKIACTFWFGMVVGHVERTRASQHLLAYNSKAVNIALLCPVALVFFRQTQYLGCCPYHAWRKKRQIRFVISKVGIKNKSCPLQVTRTTFPPTFDKVKSGLTLICTSTWVQAAFKWKLQIVKRTGSNSICWLSSTHRNHT